MRLKQEKLKIKKEEIRRQKEADKRKEVARLGPDPKLYKDRTDVIEEKQALKTGTATDTHIRDVK